MTMYTDCSIVWTRLKATSTDSTSFWTRWSHYIRSWFVLECITRIKMGLLISKVSYFWNELWLNLLQLAEAYDNWKDTPARILLLGLDNAGKTTCLYKLKLNKTVSTIPTIGFNVETLQPVPGLTMTVWDVCAQDKARDLWRHYYHGKLVCLNTFLKQIMKVSMDWFG